MQCLPQRRQQISSKHLYKSAKLCLSPRVWNQKVSMRCWWGSRFLQNICTNLLNYAYYLEGGAKKFLWDVDTHLANYTQLPEDCNLKKMLFWIQPAPALFRDVVLSKCKQMNSYPNNSIDLSLFNCNTCAESVFGHLVKQWIWFPTVMDMNIRNAVANKLYTAYRWSHVKYLSLRWTKKGKRFFYALLVSVV
jgi:hypothetical protein